MRVGSDTAPLPRVEGYAIEILRDRESDLTKSEHHAQF